LKNLKNVETHVIWEDKLLAMHPDFPKRSFLLIDNHVTSEIKQGDFNGYFAFGNRESIERLKTRFEKLLLLDPVSDWHS
jgi:hypothetical protein